jgi:hypothetical protein
MLLVFVVTQGVCDFYSSTFIHLNCTMHSYAVLGHSVPWHLEKYCLHRPERQHLRLGTTGHVDWLCRKGLTVQNLLAGDALPELLHGARPDIIFMQLGGNDFRRGVPAEDLAVQLLALAGLLHGRYGVRRVVVGEVLPRFQAAGAPRWYTLNGDQASSYRIWAAQVNVHLHMEAHGLPYVKIWSHNDKFSMGGCRSLFSQDVIHLSEKGLYHLWKSVRGALTCCTH